jgi:hypothetical protein
VTITATCPDETCTVTVAGSLKAATLAKLRSPRAVHLLAGKRATLRLTIGSVALATAATAIRHHRRVVAVLVVTARDAAGNSTRAPINVTLVA